MPRRKHNPQPSKRLSAEGDEEAEGENGDEDKERPVMPEEMSSPSTATASPTSLPPSSPIASPLVAATRAAKRCRTASPQPACPGNENESDQINVINKEEELKGKTEGSEKTTPQPSPVSTPGKNSGKKAASPKGKSPVGTESPGNTLDAGEGAADGDNKRNLSLEALFQVTHSELQNISRQGDSNPQTVKHERSPKSEKIEDSVTLPSAYAEGITSRTGQPIILAVVEAPVEDTLAKSEAVKQELHLVTTEADIPEQVPLQIEIQVENPEEEENVESVATDSESSFALVEPDKGEGETQIQLKTLEQQGLKLVYTKKTYDQYEPNPVSFVTYKQRPQVQKEVPQMIETDSIQIGRKRKHPQKPGRHICPYCGRGCAKPSVLQKHIRAHTGERPYPCIPCGFSFKTKSNLYKHCKSRAHALKAGGSSTSDQLSSIGDDSFQNQSVGSEGSDVGSDNETDMLEDDGISETSLEQTTPKSSTVLVSEPVQTVSQNVMISTQSSEENLGQLLINTSEAGAVQWVDSNGTLVPVMTKVILTDKQFYDVAQVSKDNVVLKQCSITPSSSEEGDQLTYTVLSSASPETDILQPKEAVPSHDIPVNPSPIAAQGKKPDGVTMTSTLQKFSDNSMKVTIQLPKMTQKPTSTTSSFVNHSDPPLKETTPSTHVHVQPKLLPAPQKRGSSGVAVSSVIPSPGPKLSDLDRKAITPEMLQERISQLISANAAIIDMPMADAPRPKRMSRQNSEVTASSTVSTPRISMTPSGSLGVDNSSLDIVEMDQVTTETRHRRPPLLSQAAVESMEEPECQVETLVVAAAESEERDTEMAPALPVPVISLGGEELQSASLIEDGQVHLQFARHPDHPALTRSQSMIGQPSVQYQRSLDMSMVRTPQNPEGSVIKDLLLKGRGMQGLMTTSPLVVSTADPLLLREGKPDGMQMLEIVDNEQVLEGTTQVILNDGSSQQMAYIVQTNQDHVPLNVAHDVEILSESPPQSKPESPVKAEPPKKGKLKKAATIDTPFQNMRFEIYDPKTPPKRGRPKGSKNRVKELPGPISLPMNNSGIMTKKFTMLKGLSGGTLVAASSSGEGPLTPQPLIGTPQVVYPRLQTGVASAPVIPMVMPPLTPLPITSTLNTVTVASPLTSSLHSEVLSHSSLATHPTLSKPSLRLTIPPPLAVLSSQSGVVTPNILGTPSVLSPAVGSPSTSLPDTPTSQSLLKLKLKGKLLMRRSMSVERALSQEKERQMQEARLTVPSPLSGKSHKQLEALRRCESLDETSPLKKRRLMYQHSVHEEHPASGFLSPFSTTLTPSPLAFPSLTKKTLTSPDLTKSKESLSYPTPIRDLCLRMDVAKKAKAGKIHENEKSPEPEAVAVVNEIMKVYCPSLPVVAPMLQASGQHILQLPIVSTLPSYWHNHLAGVLRAYVPISKTHISSKSTDDAGNSNQDVEMVEKSNEYGDDDVKIIRIEKNELPKVLFEDIVTGVGKHSVEESIKFGDHVGSGDSKSVSCGDASSSMSLLHTPVSIGDGLHIKLEGPTNGGKWSGGKNAVQMLLSGHKHPVLRTLTHITFCTLSKPQPMYVPLGSNKKISMYSNWRVAKFNPNPMGLTTKMMLSLHHTHRCHIDSADTMAAITPTKQGVLTHSSYWNFYNRRKAALQVQQLRHQVSETSTESKAEDLGKIVAVSPDVQMMTVKVVDEDNQTKAVHVPVVHPPKQIQLPHDPSQEEVYPHIPAETTIQVCVVDAVTAKTIEVIGTSNPEDQEPKREHIFKGGYKTDEKYVYVRGRGRGKYVCEECGIRCKKPSMLKKHIRTHTDLRPYHCHHCKFSFKTKGNLTKHMKSKAHHKKCLELGLNPIPVTVDDSQIDNEALSRQIELAKGGKDGIDYTLDGSDDDEDDDEDEEGEIIEEEIVVIDEPESPNSKSSDVTKQMDSEGPQFLAVREVDGNQSMLQLVRIGSTGELVIEPDQYKVEEQQSLQADEGEERNTAISGKDKDEHEGPRPSIDKEIAHSLLDLSKASEHAQNEEIERCKSDGLSETQVVTESDDQKGNQRLDSLIKEVMTRTKPPGEGSHQTLGLDLNKQGEEGDVVVIFPTTTTSSILDKAGHASAPLAMVRMATTIYQSTSTIKHPVDLKLTSASEKNISQSQRNTYAHKIAALQSANEKDLSLSIGRGSVNMTGSGFVPPILLASGELRTPMESPRTPITPLTTVPIIGTLLKEFSMTTPGLSSIVSLGSGSTSHPPSSSSDLQAEEKHASPLKCKDSERNRTECSGDVTSEDTSVVEEPTSSPTTKLLPDTSASHTDYSDAQPLPGTSHIKDSNSAPIYVTGTTLQSPTTSATIHFVTSENRAPFEIVPIPGKVSENVEDLVDGKYLCNICNKAFPKQHQLTLHKNIHYFERPFRCESCSISFRTKGHLQKHQRTESHLAKQNINQQFGVPSPDNPRPFRCDDCNIAFRIHGHLAKHLRSKSHITALEKNGKVPQGTYALIEKRDLNEIDATDCETTLESVLHMLDPSHIPSSTGAKSPSSSKPSQMNTLTSANSTEHENRKELRSNSQANSPIREQFQYTRVGSYEKDFVASNERVTVEKINLEPIDFSQLGSTSSQGVGDAVRFGESEQDLDRSGGSGSFKSGTVSGKSSPQPPSSPQNPMEKGPHKCGICGKTYKAISLLKQHVVTHAELRPYVCEYCDAGFTTPQSLKFHLRTHTQERPYVCGRCGDTFARSDNLHQHMVIHGDIEGSDGEDASTGHQTSGDVTTTKPVINSQTRAKDEPSANVPKTVQQSAETSVVKAAAQAVAAKASTSSPTKTDNDHSTTVQSETVESQNIVGMESELSDGAQLRVPWSDGKTAVLGSDSLSSVQFSVADEQTKAKVAHLLGSSSSSIDRVEVLELKPEHVEALQLSSAGMTVTAGQDGEQVQILYLAESREHGLSQESTLVTDPHAVLSLATSQHSSDTVSLLSNPSSQLTAVVNENSKAKESVETSETSIGTVGGHEVEVGASQPTSAAFTGGGSHVVGQVESIRPEAQTTSTIANTSKVSGTSSSVAADVHVSPPVVEMSESEEPPTKVCVIELPSGEKVARSADEK